MHRVRYSILVMWWFQMVMMPVTEVMLPVAPLTEVMLTGVGRVADPGTMMAVAAVDRRAAAGRHAGTRHDLHQGGFKPGPSGGSNVTPRAASSLGCLAAAAPPGGSWNSPRPRRSSSICELSDVMTRG